MQKQKMSLEQWKKFTTSLKYGDICSVFCDDISGKLIEFGSAENKSIDPFGFEKFLHPVHSFRYLGLGTGLTIEADPKGTQRHTIDEYRDRVMSGDTRIIVDRHNYLTLNEFNYIKAECDRQVGKPYGWGAIIGTGLYRFFRDNFIGGWIRAWKWNTPFCDRNNPVCSQGVRLQEDNVKRFFDVLYPISKWQDNTPQRLLDEQPNVSERVIDTFLIARDNKYDYIK